MESTTTFEYDIANSVRRLRLVRTDRGFALGFNYQSASSWTINKVCAVDLASNYVTAAAPCPVGVPAATYAYTGPNDFQLATYTDPAAQATTYTYDALTAGIATITNPGSVSPDLTNTYHPTSYKLISQTYANGATWTYTYEDQDTDWETYPNNDWNQVTDPLSHVTLHTFLNSTGPGAPASVTDPLLRTTQFLYWNGFAGNLQRRTEPEGNYLHNTYDARRNITEMRRVAKTGSGIPDIVTTASFPATCTNQKTCNQPTATTDARSNVTDYTYSTTHGGVLTETGPAPTVRGAAATAAVQLRPALCMDQQ